MRSTSTIKVNFPGGIISPGELYNILVAAGICGLTEVRFGLRQQLLIDVSIQNQEVLVTELTKLNINFEINNDQFPNIVSSYAAEEAFINDTWLSEGVYKDILDAIDYSPKLKINISDGNQSFTPMLTGNINWVASSTSQHFWHLLVRFPKTNTIYEWDHLVYTNDVAKLSLEIENVILNDKTRFYNNGSANGIELFKQIRIEQFIIRLAETRALLPAFNLPYYEGINRYDNKYWLGIYRRDELFSIAFLKEFCMLCLKTKIGQLCSTAWKTVIVKGINESDKAAWNRLLESHQVNMRHAANELNFQVEDNCNEGLRLKSYLVKRLNNEDIRTFGLCIGIKTRKKSEVFSSILIRRKSLLSIFGVSLFHVYDILCAHDFNPNERTGFVFSSNNPKFLLGEQLRRAVTAFYNHRSDKYIIPEKVRPARQSKPEELNEFVFQCGDCLTIYDERTGEPESNISAGTKFELLPMEYACTVCEASKDQFKKINKKTLGLQPV